MTYEKDFFTKVRFKVFLPDKKYFCSRRAYVDRSYVVIFRSQTYETIS